MEIGDNFKHKYINNLTCEVIEHTAKGAKILQTEGRKKPVVKFYNSMDFSGDRKFWEFTFSSSDPKIIKASELGIKAFKEHKKRIPYHDKELSGLLIEVLSHNKDNGISIKITEAWLKSWDKENLSQTF